MKYFLAGLWTALVGAGLWGVNFAHKTCCVAVPKVSVTTPAVPTKSLGPLVFNWASGAAITNSGFAAYRDSIIGTLGDSDKLEIVGLYTKDEKNNSSFDNMGLARADATKKLFAGYLPDDRIILEARVVDQLDKEHPFAAAEFHGRRVSKAIVETKDEVVIYFPLNSSSKLNSTEIEQYLDEVAKRVIASGEKVDLTGHTCDRGDAKRNMRLGQKRADMVAKYLIHKGVPKSQVLTHSDGETNPMVPNTSEENRVKNRRTVLKILK